MRKTKTLRDGIEREANRHSRVTELEARWVSQRHEASLEVCVLDSPEYIFRQKLDRVYFVTDSLELVISLQLEL